MRPKRLQVALDFVCPEDALAMLDQIREHADHIEIGTPLVKAAGVQGIRILSTLAHLSNRKAVADFKTLDTGFLEAELGFNAGADYITVAASAPIETILGALEAKRQYGKGIIIDCIGVDPLTRAEDFKQYGIDNTIDYIEVHRGIDEAGSSGFDRFLDQLRSLKDRIPTKLAVAGGLNETTVRQVAPYVELVIVGNAITRAERPAEAAWRIRRAMEGRE